MIHSLIIIRDGIPLFHYNFGQSHGLNSNIILISAFLEAMDSLAREIKQGSIDYIQFEYSKFIFLTKKGLLFIVVADINDDVFITQTKTMEIAELFHEMYEEKLKVFSGNIREFSEFKVRLMELGIVPSGYSERTEDEDFEDVKTTNQILTLLARKKSEEEHPSPS